MSKRPKTPRRPRAPTDRRSPWNYLAPAALLGAVTVITLILSSAGVLGHTSDGNPPASTAPCGPGARRSRCHRRLHRPSRRRPSRLRRIRRRRHRRPPRRPRRRASTTETTTTTASTTETTPETTTTEKTGNDGQHVKWTVKPGDTLGSIATQFGTSVRALQRLNPSIDPDALQIGQEIVVR